jgi:hypothetical protein
MLIFIVLDKSLSNIDLGTFIILILFCSVNTKKDESFTEESGIKYIVMFGAFIISQSLGSLLTGALLLALLYIVEISILHHSVASKDYIKQKIGKGLVVVMVTTFILFLKHSELGSLSNNLYLVLALFISGSIDSDEGAGFIDLHKGPRKMNELIQLLLLPYIFLKVLDLSSTVQGATFDNVTIFIILFSLVWMLGKSFLRNSNQIIINRVMKLNIFSIFLMNITYLSVSNELLVLALLANFFLYKVICYTHINKSNSRVHQLVSGLFFAAPFSPIFVYKIHIIISNSKLILPLQNVLLVIICLLPMLAYSKLAKTRILEGRKN